MRPRPVVIAGTGRMPGHVEKILRDERQAGERAVGPTGDANVALGRQE